eukprot:XP_025007179.1 uncharacterized protein LOC107053454 isoform X2 [Gallus gallus]
MYISYCTVWEGHDLARCRRFPGINPSSPFPSCNLLRMAPRAHAERHTAARTHTRSAARERSGAPDGAVIGRAARGEGDVSSRSLRFLLSLEPSVTGAMTQPEHITHFYSHDLEIRAVSNQNYTATIELFNRIQLRSHRFRVPTIGCTCCKGFFSFKPRPNKPGTGPFVNTTTRARERDASVPTFGASVGGVPRCGSAGLGARSGALCARGRGRSAALSAGSAGGAGLCAVGAPFSKLARTARRRLSALGGSRRRGYCLPVPLPPPQGSGRGGAPSLLGGSGAVPRRGAARGARRAGPAAGLRRRDPAARPRASRSAVPPRRPPRIYPPKDAKDGR